MNLGAPKHHPNCEPEYWIETEVSSSFEMHGIREIPY